MKKLVLILSLAIPLALSAQEDTIRFTLPQCIQYAFSNSYDRRSMELNESSQQESVRGAKLQYAPSISASLGENLNHTGDEDVRFGGNVNLGANINIYNPSTVYNVTTQELQLERTKYQTAQYDQNLRIQIIQEYVTIIGEMELIKYQEKIVSTSEQQLSEGEKKYRLGSILESDYLLLDAQYQTNLTNLVDSRNSLTNSLFQLKVLMSMDPTKNLAVAKPEDEIIAEMRNLPSLEYAIEQGLANMPDMKLIEASLAIARHQVKASKAGYIPSIGASASIGTSHSNFENFGEQLKNSFSQSFGISVSIPIYDKSQTETNVRKAKISLQQAELDKDQMELEIRNTMVQSYLNCQTAIASFDATTKKYQAWQKTLDAYNEKFRLGAITTVDLLQQENNYIAALNDYIQSKYKFLLQRSILAIYMGETQLPIE